MRIYISGPVTNVLDYKEKFDRAEKHLKAEFPKAEIINPTMIELPESCQSGIRLRTGKRYDYFKGE